MWAKLGGLAGLLLFPLLCIYAITNGSLQIQTELRNRVDGRIQDYGIENVQVAADGREIILTGQVPNPEQQSDAGVQASRILGVRSVDNRITIVPDAEEIQADINQILLSKKIEFESSRSVLLPSSVPVLEDVLGVLQGAPDIVIEVEGHTDDSGDPATNRELSQERAEAVVNWLAEQGIAPDRMKAVGYGPDRPIALNDTPEGRAENRRVEIVASER